MKIVISQPMYFPWIGIFEQIRLCDVYVHYDDVQFSKGSFTNRVQIKSNSQHGFNWLTVPLKNLKFGSKINEVEINHEKNWQHQHLQLLHEYYRKAPYYKEMLEIVHQIFAMPLTTISELSQQSIEVIARYFDLTKNTQFHQSSQLNIAGTSSQRVYDITKRFHGTHYITAHGAKNYLEHKLFDDNGIRVEYIDYLKVPYPQQHGEFTPYVSALDLIANVGQEGKEYIKSSTKYWQEFLV